MPTFDNLNIIIDELTAMNDLQRKRKLSSIIMAENVSCLTVNLLSEPVPEETEQYSEYV